MINSNYIYLLFPFISILILGYWFFYSKSNKNDISNKLLLKSLLESLDLDLPDELKTLDNSSSDAQKLS
tara:strand:+ start:327 stop:533 length:207 start_codon:yes stop_codon:yes gene_type:complete